MWIYDYEMKKANTEYQERTRNCWCGRGTNVPFSGAGVLPPKPVAAPDPGPSASDVQSLVDALVPTATGGCVAGGLSIFGAGSSGSLCGVQTPGGGGTLFSVGVDVGVVLPGVTVGGASLVSNAEVISDLRGPSVCFGGGGSAGVAGGSGLACAGLTAAGGLNGIVTVILTGDVGLTLPGFTVTVGTSYSWTWSHSSRAPTNIGLLNSDPLGESHVGRHMSGTQPSFYNAGRPG